MPYNSRRAARKKAAALILLPVILCAFFGFCGPAPMLNAAEKPGLPANFRMSDAKYIRAGREKKGPPDLAGLAGLHIAGSAQFSQQGLAAVAAAIGRKNLVVVDLRQESHGFVNGAAVSLYGENNKLNRGFNAKESSLREMQFLSFIKPGTRLSLSNSAPIEVRTVESESRLAASMGIRYIRVPVTDKESPTGQEVDGFLAAARKLPKGSWLYFHCMAGEGRTTTFMAMADMMKNAKAVSFDAIIYRQYLLGGEDLAAQSAVEDSAARYAFLKLFYSYCRQNRDGFATSFTSWEKQTYAAADARKRPN